MCQNAFRKVNISEIGVSKNLRRETLFKKLIKIKKERKFRSIDIGLYFELLCVKIILKIAYRLKQQKVYMTCCMKY